MASDAIGDAVRGDWFAPGSSVSRPASLVRADGVRLLGDDGAELILGEAGGIAVSPRVGRIPRRVRFADGSVFVTLDNDGIDRLRITPAARRSGLVHDLERFRPRLAAFVVVVALMAFAIYRYALPVMIEVAVAVTPPVVPQMIGSAAIDTLDRVLLSETELPPDRQRDLETQFAALAQFSDLGADGFNLVFRDGGPLGPNALALPDGTVILTDQLVALADDDEMILGVLAHEIGHVELQHSLRQVYRLAGMSALIMLIAGDVGEAVEELLVEGSALLSLSYSRAHESEADRRSVELMLKAGHDPLAINRFFASIREELGVAGESGMLSTHPGTAERAEALEAYAAELRGRQ